MACTRDPALETRKTATNAKATHKGKQSPEGDTMVGVEVEQPGKKVKKTVSKPKRRREVDNLPASEPEEAVAVKKKRTAKEPTAPEPQAVVRRSDRAHPTTIAAPQRRKRRTKEEIAEDKAKADTEKRRKEELTQENQRAMAQMDIDEDIDRAEAVTRTIRSFGELEDDSGEEFPGYAAVEDSDSESDGEAEDALALKEANKALQRQLKALKAQVDGGKTRGKGGKKASQKVTFASGLLPDWNEDADSINEPAKKQTHVQISVGGLDDSDAEAVNPFPLPKSGPRTLTDEELTKGTQKAERDLSRRNEAGCFSLVTIVATESDKEEYVPHAAAKKAAVKIPSRVRVKAAPCKESVPAKEQKPKKIPVPVKPVDVATKSNQRLNGNKVRISDLPGFAEEKWRTTFLPTLYDKFFTSDKPFDAFYVGSDEFVALLQDVVEEVYPEVEYKVTSSDPIHFLAYNRVTEKRSSIGSGAIDLVEKHLNSLKEGQAAKDWLRWALRISDGPLFFKEPSPTGSPVNPKDPEYQFPGGRLLSPFIIGLAAPFLSLRAGSASDNGYPKGLVALIMGALERAVRHLSKPSDKLKIFSKESWGSQVGTYYDSIGGKRGVSEARWKELVEACLPVGRLKDSEDDTFDADLSILDNDRAHVFDFCSPAKPRA